MTAAREFFTTLKLLYVVLLASGLFFLRDVYLLLSLLVAHLALWFLHALDLNSLLRALNRLKFFVLIIVISYLFISTGDTAKDYWREIALFGFTFSINLAGALLGLLMSLRIAILVIASSWMQKTSAPGELVRALRRVYVPEILALSIDGALALLGDELPRRGHGTGSGGGQGKHQRKDKISFMEIRQGKLEFVTSLIRQSVERAGDYLANRYSHLPPHRLQDLLLIVTISLVVMGLKVLQVLPGIPIASGHKNVIIVPLLLFAAFATRSRFGGLLTGTSVGIISFLLGYGKFGILEIAHFAVPGLLADLLIPFMRAGSNFGKLLQFAVAGVVLGLGRFAANFLVIVLAGAPQLAFLILVPMLLSQVTFGALSCFVSLSIVNRAFASNVFGVAVADRKENSYE